MRPVMTCLLPGTECIQCINTLRGARVEAFEWSTVHPASVSAPKTLKNSDAKRNDFLEHS